MSKKSGFEKTLDFLAGKGFYIILIACIAAIGISGYVLLWSDKPTPETEESQLEWLEPEEEVETVLEVPEETQSVSEPWDSGVLEVINPENIDIAPPSVSPAASKPSKAPVSSPVASPATSPAASPVPSLTPAPSSQPDKPAAASEDAETVMAAESVVFQWPVIGEISLPHSVEQLVYNKTMGDWRAHPGIDILSAEGTEVTAAADGTVKDIYKDTKLGYCVVIEHGYGLVSLYANLQEEPPALLEKSVKAGDIIGNIGKTAEWEIAEEPHLHFEVFYNGNSDDPLKYLPDLP